jgi:hypothetical protein
MFLILVGAMTFMPFDPPIPRHKCRPLRWAAYEVACASNDDRRPRISLNRFRHSGGILSVQLDPPFDPNLRSNVSPLVRSSILAHFSTCKI